MENIKVGDRLLMHSYKHDGKIHRSWDEAVLLDVVDDCYIFGNEKTKVVEADGKVWKTKEPAVLFFFKESWFNVIGQCKKDGIYYYCNLASPFIIDEGAIKYIDYDLDLRVFLDGSFKILDRGEYNYHKSKMKYPNEVDLIMKAELTNLIDLARSKKGPFTPGRVEEYYKMYTNIKNAQKN